jgi:membrane fusion protein, copper/silver efflux system
MRYTILAIALIAASCKQEASAPAPAQNAPGTPTMAAPSVENSAAFDAAMTAALPSYLTIQEALAADKIDGVAPAAEALATSFAALDPSAVTGAGAPAYAMIKTEGPAAAKRLAAAKDVVGARAEFKAVSKLIAPWAVNARPAGVDLVWCDMAPGGWLQKTGPVRNPYYGASMLECGEKQQLAGK